LIEHEQTPFCAVERGGGLTLAVAPRALLGQAPTVMNSKPAKPVVIASANGNKFKNGGDVTCVQKAFTMMTQGGSDVLDALTAGVNIVELDPLDDSVGYGGLPNADGVVQLDSCCMHGPKRRAGGVACLEVTRHNHAALQQTISGFHYGCTSRVRKISDSECVRSSLHRMVRPWRVINIEHRSLPPYSHSRPPVCLRLIEANPSEGDHVVTCRHLPENTICRRLWFWERLDCASRTLRPVVAVCDTNSVADRKRTCAHEA
jgi:asparaginase